MLYRFLCVIIVPLFGRSNGLRPDVAQGDPKDQTLPYTPEGYEPLAKYTRPATEQESSGMYKKSMNAKAGDHNYRAFVGPPNRYGDMAGTEFSLLFMSGLQETDKLLDIGCGSMRLARLAVPFMQPGHFHCIEPNSWLIQDGLHYELGNEILHVKAPKFAFNYEFEPPVVEGKKQMYDYMIAQSIFSHTGQDMYESALKKLATHLHKDSIFLATSVPGTQQESCSKKQGWIYPECCTMTDDYVLAAAEKADLFAVPLAWPHKAQKWYAYCRGGPHGRARCMKLAKIMPRIMVNSWQIRDELNDTVDNLNHP